MLVVGRAPFRVSAKMKLIPLTGYHGAGKSAIVDDDDYEELNKYRWYFNTIGYPCRSIWVGEKTLHRMMHTFTTYQQC